jgi:hypothetical protein
MLLAQLCGEGRRTEAILRSHGFEDLKSIVNADSRKLSETLGISDKSAIRMVRQAEELLESTLEKKQHLDSKRPPSKPGTKKAGKVKKPRKPDTKPAAAAGDEVEKEQEIETTLMAGSIPQPVASPADVKEIKVSDRSRETQPGVTAAELGALRPEGTAPSAMTSKSTAALADEPPDDGRGEDSEEKRRRTVSFWYFG